MISVAVFYELRFQNVIREEMKRSRNNIFLSSIYAIQIYYFATHDDQPFGLQAEESKPEATMAHGIE